MITKKSYVVAASSEEAKQVVLGVHSKRVTKTLDDYSVAIMKGLSEEDVQSLFFDIAGAELIERLACYVKYDMYRCNTVTATIHLPYIQDSVYKELREALRDSEERLYKQSQQVRRLGRKLNEVKQPFYKRWLRRFG